MVEDALQARFQRVLDLHRANELVRAEAEYRALLLDVPQHVNALQLLGALLLQMGRYFAACPVLQSAIVLDPGQANYYSNLGEAYRRQGSLDRARRHIETALKLDPAQPDAIHNLGLVMTHLGEMEVGKTLLQDAIRRVPNKPLYYYSLADAGGTLNDDALTHLQALAEAPGLLPRDEGALHVTLGRLLNAKGESERAFRHLLAGNKLRRAGMSYDERATLGFFERIAVAFSDRTMGRAEAGSIGPHSPIFIVGMPRSGTTLVEQILASHSRAYGAGELDFFPRSVMAIWGDTNPEHIENIQKARPRAVGADYLRRVSALSPLRVVDKMPMNFLYCGLIALAIPDARIIHMMRDPIDTCLSCFSTMFASEMGFAADLGELGRFYRHYLQLMSHWRQVLPRGTMLDVRYEEMVADQERETRHILAHCDLAWEESCLAYHRTNRAVVTASTAQVRRPINRSGIGRWRPPASLLAPLLVELNLAEVY